MSFYHINPKPLPDGSYEVHKEGCGLLVPNPERIDLGSHLTMDSALANAIFALQDSGFGKRTTPHQMNAADILGTIVDRKSD